MLVWFFMPAFFSLALTSFSLPTFASLYVCLCSYLPACLPPSFFPPACVSACLFLAASLSNSDCLPAIAYLPGFACLATLIGFFYLSDTLPAFAFSPILPTFAMFAPCLLLVACLILLTGLLSQHAYACVGFLYVHTLACIAFYFCLTPSACLSHFACLLLPPLP
jgi:hypothetical protein